MFLSARRVVLFGVIAAIVAVIVFLPAILVTLSGQGITDIKISLNRVEEMSLNDANKTISLKVIFAFLNPTDRALTTSRIDYNLSGNDILLGTNTLSYDDIPLNGRPQLYPGKTIFLPSTFVFTPSAKTSFLYDKLAKDPSVARSMTWTVNGEAQIDSAFTTLPKAFESSLP